uniref:CCHC-type domain-containing protein n=1 Tax=Chromera velia CCMP2878 TaxID=1169474 RepID=A0A0G4GJC3_9ALVE|eukprot:Cvel_22149.t1-p1 / transcript=Cvel_22149.t1 / gene=Cvel_22149 / organism=Chromera_velia_CCMP2878 / gene_product=Retrotransposon-derived protein PEG10, putative / transcript_product=Retrotransposon-derived protein PEG10, putative / location=Cvel_scaffold2149:6602-7708(-) / protein_length=369 / sequence_SO=supercontig / SO=protein_coding / is_pseudo=false
MDLVGNPQAQAALQERFEQLLNRVQQLLVIAEHQQQEIAELKAQLGHQSSLAQSSFQSHSGDVLRPSPPPSVKPKKPEIFSEKAEDVNTWIALWQNLYHITKTPPEEQAPIAVTYLSPTLQVKLAEEARAEGIPITSLEGLKEALYRSFPDPNVQETLRSEIRQICAKKGVWDYTDEFRGIARRLMDMTQMDLMYDYKAGLPKAVSDEIGRVHPKPDTLPKLITEALKAEKRVAGGNRGNHWNHGQSNGGQKKNGEPVSIDLSALSRAEKQQLRREGRCYLCRERGHIHFDCPGPRSSQPSGGRRNDWKRGGERQMIQNQQYGVPLPRSNQRSQQQQQYPPHRQWGGYDQRQNGQGRRQPPYGQGRNSG